MEKNNDIAINNHDISLQLRSKEVSEVMGNIPSWVGVWGTFLIFILFITSMLMVFNIHCVERISSRATIVEQQIADTFKTVSQDYLLRVSMPTTEHSKIKVGQKVTLSFPGENNYLNKLIDNGFLVNKITTNKDSCILQLVAQSDNIGKEVPDNSALFNKVENCQLVSDVTVFEKVFGSLF